MTLLSLRSVSAGIGSGAQWPWVFCTCWASPPPTPSTTATAGASGAGAEEAVGSLVGAAGAGCGGGGSGVVAAAVTVTTGIDFSSRLPVNKRIKVVTGHIHFEYDLHATSALLHVALIPPPHMKNGWMTSIITILNPHHICILGGKKDTNHVMC